MLPSLAYVKKPSMFASTHAFPSESLSTLAAPPPDTSDHMLHEHRQPKEAGRGYLTPRAKTWMIRRRVLDINIK